MWMIAGIAGGIQPWWHYVGAYHEDRRMYTHAGAGDALVQGQRSVIWSIASRWRPSAWHGRSGIPIFYGRNDPAETVDAPYTGFMHALVRARIPYLPVHVDDLDSRGPRLEAVDSAECGGVVRRAVRSDPAVRGTRRLAVRDRRNQSV